MVAVIVEVTGVARHQENDLGQNALHTAVECGDVACSKLLLQYNVNITQDAQGSMCFIWLCKLRTLSSLN